jgi:hypothetical protein
MESKPKMVRYTDEQGKDMVKIDLSDAEHKFLQGIYDYMVTYAPEFKQLTLGNILYLVLLTYKRETFQGQYWSMKYFVIEQLKLIKIGQDHLLAFELYNKHEELFLEAMYRNGWTYPFTSDD